MIAATVVRPEEGEGALPISGDRLGEFWPSPRRAHLSVARRIGGEAPEGKRGPGGKKGGTRHAGGEKGERGRERAIKKSSGDGFEGATR